MAKPTQKFTWATDPVFTSGPDLGVSTRLHPPQAMANQGWRPSPYPPDNVTAEHVPARYMNNLMGLMGDWFEYLSVLETDPDFLDEDFVWGGAHTFNGTLTVTSGADQTSLTGFVHVENNLGLTGNAEIVYTPQRKRTRMINISKGISSTDYDKPKCCLVSTYNVTTGADWADLRWQPTSSATGIAAVHLETTLPSGCTFLRARAGVRNGGISASRFQIFVNEVVQSKDEPWGLVSNTAALSVPLDLQPGASGVLTAIPFWDKFTPIDNSTTNLHIEVQLGVLDTQLWWVEVDFMDPGPRNY